VAGADAARLVRIVIDHDPAWKLLMSHSGAGSASSSTGKGGSGGPDEAIGAVGLLAALLGRVSDADVCQSLLQGMIDRIESYGINANQDDGSDNDEESKSSLVQLKLGMMCALYNLRSKPTEKCWLLGRILTLAGSCSIPNVQYSLLPERNTALGRLLIPKELERLINDDFGGSTIAAVSSTSSTSLSTETKSNDNNTNDAPLTPEVIRTLYRIASDVVGTVAIACRVRGDAMEKEARAAVATQQTFLLMMLKTYTTMSDVDAEAIAAAKAAAIGAIRDPVALFTQQRGILSLPPVASLEMDPATKNMHTLLKIFQEGKLEDFHAFLASHPQDLQTWNLSEEECTRHMRLLSLCSLATEHEEVPYAAIATTLRVDPSEVEVWVIAAVSSGLLSAKMDQLQGVVMVERCAVRRFGMEQWRAIQSRLDSWKRNVGGMLEGLRQAQDETPTMSPMAVPKQ